MSKPKIIFFDIDGTLIEKKKSITPKMLETLHALQDNGIMICIASGRPPVQLPKLGVDFDVVVDQDTVYQIMVGCREKDYDGLVANTQNAKVTAWWDRAADIIPATGSKGVAIEKVLDYYQIPVSEAIAFGDGGNDIEMLKTVGHGVAMGNATDDVKEIADDICGSVQDDGIFTYCKKHNLI